MKIIIALAIVVVVFISWRLLAQKANFPSKLNVGEKPLLRQFCDLTPEDFTDHSVWVHCHVIDYDMPWYNDTDEETFRPWQEGTPVDPAMTIYLVRATFRLADGTSLAGFITPQNPNDNHGKPHLGTIQPQLFLPSGKRAPFWFGVMAPTKQEITDFYSSLKKTEKNIFPITFTAEQGLSTGITSGSILGFHYIKKDETVAIVR